MSQFKELFRRAVLWLLTMEAKAVVRKYRPKIIAVTGSVGKTTTKDAIYAALSKNHFVRRSEKGYNSDIGVPLTILGVPNGWSNPVQWIKNILEGLLMLVVRTPYPTWLVVEIGGDRPGDITVSLKWLQPDVVVATRFPDVPVHVEFYASPEALLLEELAPLSWLTEGGLAVVNADDARALACTLPHGVQKITYGMNSGADVRGSRYHVSSKNHMPTGFTFDVDHAGAREHVGIEGYVGHGHLYAVLAGIAVSVGLGDAFTEAVSGARMYSAPAGRTRLIQGVRGTVIIDDSYNSSPIAVHEGLETLKDIPRIGRRIAVLADMLELGSYSVAEHKKVGKVAAESCDILVTAGIRARSIADSARAAGMNPVMVKECERGSDAAPYVLSIAEKGDVIFVKGSQAMRMERVVKALMVEPEKASELLVRQEPEWLIR